MSLLHSLLRPLVRRGGPLARSLSSKPLSALLDGHDPEQVRLMSEACIAVTPDDVPTGAVSKRDAHHLVGRSEGVLHRAFSVFLFNERGHLLLQQRAESKVTFPGHWTNTCCSHPLHVANELIEEDQIGVRSAATRKLYQELGIIVPVEAQRFLTRIHYAASSCSDWGEHEIDYILFTPKIHVNPAPNPNEVMAFTFVSQDELGRMMANDSIKITPWFRLIYDTFLLDWWTDLQGDNLDKHEGDTRIHRL